jgi:hypothetical protein
VSKNNSTKPATTGKPAKPHPKFSLFPHPAGVWAKKIRGKMCYFGPWSAPDAALARYLEQKDAPHPGRKPRTDNEGLTVKEMANQFLSFKRTIVDAGELTNRSWEDYKSACDLIVSHFGKSRLVADLDPDDFADLRKEGLGFYTLRHTFRTMADEAKDQPVVDFMMGHEVPHMSAVYRETISDERLRAVADHVRAWLFTEATASVNNLGPE